MSKKKLKTRWIACAHRNLNRIGSEETGLRRISCADCGAALTRLVAGPGYVYEVVTLGRTPRSRKPKAAVKS